MRTIILHYHLFKNAGTSLDAILKQNFPDRWVTQEFPGQNNTAQVIDWIQDSPDAVAFSSHTMMGPLPRIGGVNIVSVMLLRDPIARIRSAYKFERQQENDNFGATLAKHTDLEGYVRVRLSMPHDRQCRNFQTWRLASLVPGPEPELERAIAALEQLSVVGQVDAFDDTVANLKDALSDSYPAFEASSVHANRTDSALTGGAQGEDTAFDTLLRDSNQDDIDLLAALNARLSSGFDEDAEDTGRDEDTGAEDGEDNDEDGSAV